MKYKLTTAPASEPISLADAKLHLRIESSITEDDDYITALIAAARHHVEKTTGLAIIDQTWTAYADAFSDEMELLRDLSSVTEIRYQDTDNAQQKLATSIYTVDTASYVGRVVLAKDQEWPDTYEEINAVEIEFVRGIAATATDVPQNLRAAMLLIIGNLYLNRETDVIGVSVAELPFGVKMLLQPYIQPNIG
ncbi:head-tail connector protein [Pontibacter sp. JAM-7]|uniref:head-tail connector protein n=1 Tax=Pontibacter sp. JAM-7 TaxID=3366581 RepID=UPI003AF47FAC